MKVFHRLTMRWMTEKRYRMNRDAFRSTARAMGSE
jgi:hypothetical protein